MQAGLQCSEILETIFLSLDVNGPLRLSRGFILTDKLGEIHELISHDSTERRNYVASAIKWSIGGKDSGHKTGHPELHRKFAVTLWHGQFIFQLIFVCLSIK